MTKLVDRRYNTFWLRLFARLTDYFLLIILRAFITTFLVLYNFDIITFVAILLIVEFTFIFYEILSYKYFGKTIGKKIFKLKVVHISEKRLLNFKEAVLRNISSIIITVIAIFTVITYSNEDLKNIEALYSGNFNNMINSDIVNKNVFNFKNIIGYMVLFNLFLWYVANFISIIFFKKRRALYDMISNSVVIIDKKI